VRRWVSHLCTTTLDGKQVGTERRHPEKSVLYRVVAEHMQTLFAEAEARSPHGTGYPTYVKREFERFLGCGLACRGFARIGCRCGFERLFPTAARVAAAHRLWAGVWRIALPIWWTTCLPKPPTDSGC